MENFLFILQIIPSCLMIASPILIAAAGGMICEKSGIVNIALEGLMTIGAFACAVSHVFLESRTAISIPFSLFIASVTGGLFSLIHAFASVSLKANQVISGTGINLLSGGGALFFCQLIFSMDRTPAYRLGILPGRFGVYPTIWIALVIIAAAWFVMKKTPIGLRLRAAGENPEATVSLGINVKKIRYAAVIISGLLAGLAGGCVILTQDIQFNAGAINGKGFIALAAVSFGRWSPIGILGSGLLFGVASGMAVLMVNFRGLAVLPSEVFSMLPFLITLLMLIFSGGKDSAPRALGQ